MEFDRKTIMIGVAVLVVIAIAIYFYRKRGGTVSGDSKASVDSNEPTIYGTMTCPYTVKQVEKYPNYKFFDCSKNKCPDFVSAFPTTKHPDGKIEVGFS